MVVINGRERRDNFEMALGNRAQLQLHRAESHGSINTWKILVICDSADPKINKEKMHDKYCDRILKYNQALLFASQIFEEKWRY